MIEIGLHPNTLTVARESRVTVAVRNHGRGRCRRIYIRIEIPPGLVLTSGKKYIEVPELGPGETYEHPLWIRPDHTGSYRIKAREASYRDPVDVRRELQLEQPLTVTFAAARSNPTGTRGRPDRRLIDEAATETDGRPGRLTFLCHSSGDKRQVRELYRRLRESSIDCWFDEEDLRPGQDWDLEIRKTIKRARFVLACLSESSINKAGYVQKELRFALDRAEEQPEGAIFLIPVRLERCTIPPRLSRLHCVDLYTPQGFDKLIETLRDDGNQN